MGITTPAAPPSIVTINWDPCKSSRLESSTQQKLKTCLFTLPPYRHCFNTHGVRKTKASVAQVMCTRSLRGQRPGDSARQAGPGKGQTASVPPGSSLSTSWCWPLHRSLRPMNGDRPGGACRATAPPSGSLGSGCPLQPTGHVAHLPARLCSSWRLQGVVLRETPSRLRQHRWRWRACAASDSATPWAAARQAPLSMGKILQWVLFPPPGEISQTERQIRE